MFCKNCGKEIDDNATFCKYCGNKIENINAEVISEEVTNSKPIKQNIDSKTFTFIILALFSWLIPILGYVIGGMLLAKSIKLLKQGERKWLALLGIVVSIVCLIASLINHILGMEALHNTPDPKNL